MKKRGSALIIALLLIAAVGGIAFGVGRIFALESTTATLYENGSIAYYAAESGLEEGFLRYRYNSNAEIPSTNWTPSGNEVYRSNLYSETTNIGNNSEGIDKSSTLVNFSEQNYDLRMGFIGTTIGSTIYPWYSPKYTTELTPTSISSPENYDTDSKGNTFIAKDDSVTIDLSNIDWSSTNTNKLNFYGKFVNVDEIDFCNVLLELKLTTKNSGSDITNQYTQLYSYNPTSCASTLGIDSSKLSSLPNVNQNDHTFAEKDNLVTEIIANAGQGAILPNNGAQVKLTIKPVIKDGPDNSGLVFGATTSFCGASTGCLNGTKSIVLTGPTTKITATGYYGGVAKKLTADIDRQNGTLYDLYEYVLFTNSEN